MTILFAQTLMIMQLELLLQLVLILDPLLWFVEVMAMMMKNQGMNFLGVSSQVDKGIENNIKNKN